MSRIPPFAQTVSFSTIIDFFHVPNLSNATREESIFLIALYSELATQANLLAGILPWELTRAKRELFAAMQKGEQ